MSYKAPSTPAMSSVRVKAHAMWALETPIEIRMFDLQLSDESDSKYINYNLLLKNVTGIFEGMKENKVQMYYKDCASGSDDLIAFDDDKGLNIGLEQMVGQTLQLYIKEKKILPWHGYSSDDYD
ncbi:uncharacterized protein O3C94_007833 [Discoglossus pictus]